MSFSAGNKVVHKTHGVGEIQGTEVLALDGMKQDYYILKIYATGLTLRFPKSSNGMIRDLVNEDDIVRIMSILGEDPKTHSSVWNRRKKEFSDKIRSGSVFDIAEVLRDLTGKDRLRQPSFGEKEMIERAKGRLISEIAAARGAPAGEIEILLDHALAAQGSDQTADLKTLTVVKDA